MLAGNGARCRVTGEWWPDPYGVEQVINGELLLLLDAGR